MRKFLIFKIKFQEGCLSAVSRSIRIDMAITGGISLAIALVMILGIVVSINSMMEVVEKLNSIRYKISNA